MRDLDKRILLDLLVTPTSLISACLGVGGLLMTGMGGPRFWGLVGLGGLFVSLTAVVSNYLFNYEAVVQSTQRSVAKEIDNERKTKMYRLEQLLLRTPEKKDEKLLNILVALREEFNDEIRSESGLASRVSPAMYVHIEAMFDKCIDLLTKSHKIWEKLQGIRGTEFKAEQQERRKGMISEVETCLDFLKESIKEIRTISHPVVDTDDTSDLEALRRKLDLQLQAAKQLQKDLSENTGFDSIEDRE